MAITAGKLAKLKNLCIILNIPTKSTQPDPKLALKLLALTYALPVLYKNQVAIRKTGNDILAATEPTFDKWGSFVLALGQAIVMMQAIPAYNNTLRMSSAELARSYKRMAKINKILEAVGLVGGTSAIAAGGGEAIKTGPVVAGAKKIGGRLIGKGPISEALVGRYGASAGARATGGALVAAAVAKFVHESNNKQMGEFRALMQHRYQSGKATSEEYKGVFSNTIDPEAIKTYREYR